MSTSVLLFSRRLGVAQSVLCHSQWRAKLIYLKTSSGERLLWLRCDVHRFALEHGGQLLGLEAL
jgi:hypothetical protein